MARYVSANTLCSRLNQRIGSDERDVEKAKWLAFRRYAKPLAKICGLIRVEFGERYSVNGHCMDFVILILGYPSRLAKFWLLLDQLPWRTETLGAEIAKLHQDLHPHEAWPDVEYVCTWINAEASDVRRFLTKYFITNMASTYGVRIVAARPSTASTTIRIYLQGQSQYVAMVLEILDFCLSLLETWVNILGAGVVVNADGLVLEPPPQRDVPITIPFPYKPATTIWLPSNSWIKVEEAKKTDSKPTAGTKPVADPEVGTTPTPATITAASSEGTPELGPSASDSGTILSGVSSVTTHVEQRAASSSSSSSSSSQTSSSTLGKHPLQAATPRPPAQDDDGAAPMDEGEEEELNGAPDSPLRAKPRLTPSVTPPPQPATPPPAQTSQTAAARAPLPSVASSASTELQREDVCRALQRLDTGTEGLPLTHELRLIAGLTHDEAPVPVPVVLAAIFQLVHGDEVAATLTIEAMMRVCSGPEGGEAVDVLGGTGAGSFVVDMLLHQDMSRGVAVRGLQLVALLATRPIISADMGRAGACAAVLRPMITFHDEYEVMSEAIKALNALLSDVDSNKGLAITAGVLTVLAPALRKWGGRVDLIVGVAKLVRVLVGHNGAGLSDETKSLWWLAFLGCRSRFSAHTQVVSATNEVLAVL